MFIFFSGVREDYLNKSETKTTILPKMRAVLVDWLIQVICLSVRVMLFWKMTNLVSNFECLFWFFFQLTLKSDLKNGLKIISFEGTSMIPWRYPKFQNSAVVKNHNNNKYSKFDTKFIIWRPIEMTWCGQKYYILNDMMLFDTFQQTCLDTNWLLKWCKITRICCMTKYTIQIRGHP